MDVIGPLRTLRRQWLLTLLLLLLTLAATAALAKRPGPYQSESQVVLLPSKMSSKAFGGNPYLSFGSSISLTADLVRREVMDPRTALALAAQGYTSAYSIVDDPDTAGPVLDVVVSGNNKYSVQHTLNGVTADVSTKLAELQAGVKPVDRITSLVVSADPEASLKLSKKARPIAVILGFGLVLTIAIPQLIDAALAKRRAARYGKRSQTEHEENGSPGKAYRRGAAVRASSNPANARREAPQPREPDPARAGSRSSDPRRDLT